MTNEITKSEPATALSQELTDARWRAARYAESTMVPKEYQKNPANCVVAMELAHRLGITELEVMQNLHVIQGRPSWAASFLIARFNSCGKFSPIQYEFHGERGDKDWSCTAFATRLGTGQEIRGEAIDWDMVLKEKWNKNPKWDSMPGHMMRFRAAAFMIREYAPEISTGFLSTEEAEDISDKATRVQSHQAAIHGVVVEPDAEAEPDDMSFKRWERTLKTQVDNNGVLECLEEIGEDGSLSLSEQTSLHQLGNKIIEKMLGV